MNLPRLYPTPSQSRCNALAALIKLHLPAKDEFEPFRLRQRILGEEVLYALGFSGNAQIEDKIDWKKVSLRCDAVAGAGRFIGQERFDRLLCSTITRGIAEQILTAANLSEAQIAYVEEIKKRYGKLVMGRITKISSQASDFETMITLEPRDWRLCELIDEARIPKEMRIVGAFLNLARAHDAIEINSITRERWLKGET